MKTDEAQDKVNFEEALKELETLIDRMEQGNIVLEESLRLFEQGTALTRRCEAALEQAEQRVQVLLADDKGKRQKLEEFALNKKPGSAPVSTEG